MAIAALILGICSLVFSWVPFLGIGCGIAATILGGIGKGKNPDKRGMAIAGLVMGIIGIVLGVIFTSCTMCAACEAADYASSYYYYY